MKFLNINLFPILQRVFRLVSMYEHKIDLDV